MASPQTPLRTLHQVPEAPGRLPLVGHVATLARDPFRFLMGLREHGDSVLLHLGRTPVLFVSDTELVHQALVAQGSVFATGRIFERLGAVFGNGLPVADIPTHRKQRRIMQPAFHRSQMGRYSTTMTANAEAMVARWSPGRRLVADTELLDLALSNTTEILFSSRLSDADRAEVHRSIPVIAHDVLVRAVMPAFLDPLPIPLNRRCDTAAARLRVIVEGILDGHYRSPQHHDDLLTVLVQARDPETGRPMDGTQLRDELITMLGAGTETTSSIAAWAVHEIARHPVAERRLVAELDAVVGDRPVTPADIPRLTCAEEILNETVRLHAAPLLTRRTVKPTVLGDIRLPAGTEVAFSPYALHRDPRHFPHPDAFWPERWQHIGSGRPRSFFLPFGGGAHKCIGDSMAWTQLHITLATIYRRWRLRPDRSHRVRQLPAAITRPD
ncbi:cytochrome P450, partial [Streptomyces clavuligerus]